MQSTALDILTLWDPEVFSIKFLLVISMIIKHNADDWIKEFINLSDLHNI